MGCRLELVIVPVSDVDRAGYLEMRARGVVTPRSMVAWWLVGLEDRRERCAEIWVAEIFGDAVEVGRSAVDWTAGSVTFFVDDQPMRRCARPPKYPLQRMVAVFDFPARSTGDDADAVPELVVDYLRGHE
jgi:hypothetical protein